MNNLKKEFKIISNKQFTSNKLKFNKYSKIYLFTTENIAGYFPNIDMKNKNVLTTCSSGDHILNAILLGSIDITCFDVNVLTKYLLFLKINAIKYLQYEEYNELFSINTTLKNTLYLKFNNHLQGDLKIFWDNLILDKNEKNFTNLFYKIDYEKTKFKYNLYLKRENYIKLKEIILSNNLNIRFYESNILCLTNKIKGKYDYLFLSNIVDYLGEFYKKNNYENYINLIEKYINKYKIKNVMLSYLYSVNNYKENKLTENNLNYFKFPNLVNTNQIDAVIFINK